MSDQKHEVIPHAETMGPVEILHPMVAAVIANKPTAETVEKMMQLQRDWEANQARRAFTSALVDLKRALPSWIEQDKTVDYDRKDGGKVHYKHASLAVAMEIIVPHLVDFGFALTWSTLVDDKGVSVTAHLTHRAGHSSNTTLRSSPDTSGSKSAPQAVASTVTLLQRYTALALLGIATRDMTEPTGNGETKQDAGRVDSALNMKAVAALVRKGKTKEECEKLVGRPVQKWTTQDVDKLRAWIAPKPVEPAKEEAKPDELKPKDRYHEDEHCHGKDCCIADTKKCACYCERCTEADDPLRT